MVEGALAWPAGEPCVRIRRLLVDQDKAILRELAAGRPVQIKGRGASMVPRIPEGEVVTVAPVVAPEVRVDDIVFVRIRRDRYLTHLVKDIAAGRYMIGNN